jgi:hypothetical protein
MGRFLQPASVLHSWKKFAQSPVGKENPPGRIYNERRKRRLLQSLAHGAL